MNINDNTLTECNQLSVSILSGSETEETVV